MSRLFVTAAAAAFSAVLACGTSAHADDKADMGHGKNKTNQTTAKVSQQKHGKGKARAIFHLRDFRGFTSYCYMPRYRCYAYFSPADALWFYWYQPSNRYVPTAYLTMYPPPVSGAAPGVPLPGTTNTLPPGGTLPGDLPPGGTSTLPPLPGQTEPPTGDGLPPPPQ